MSGQARCISIPGGRWLIHAGALALCVGAGVFTAVHEMQLYVLGLGLLVLAMVLSWETPLTALILIAARPVVDLFVHVSVGGVSLGVVWGALWVASTLGVGTRLLLVRELPRSFRQVVVSGLLLVLGVLLFGVRGGHLGDSVEASLKVGAIVGGSVAGFALMSDDRTRSLTLGATYWLLTLITAVVLVVSLRDAYGMAYYAGAGQSAISQGPHGLSAMLVFGIPLVLIARQVRPPRTGLWWVLVGAACVATVGSLVRSTVIALAIVLLVWTYTERLRGGLSGTLGSWLLLIGGGIAGVLLVGDVFGGRLAEISDALTLSKSSTGALAQLGSGRLGIWLATIWGIGSSPESLLFGAGTGAATSYVRAGYGLSVYAHNDVLEMWATGGLALASLYMLFVTRLAASIRRLRHTELVGGQSIWHIAIGSLVAWLVIGMLNGVMFYQASALFGFGIGISSAIGIMDAGPPGASGGTGRQQTHMPTRSKQSHLVGAAELMSE